MNKTSVTNYRLKLFVPAMNMDNIRGLKNWRYRFSIGANSFSGVCSFRFYDICKTVRVDSGC